MFRESRKWARLTGGYLAFLATVSLGVCAFLAISANSASAQSQQYKHHGCKHNPKHGRCHRHKKPKQGGKKVHLVPPEQRKPGHIPVKTGPFCDQHVFASPDPAECGYNPPPCTQDICGPVDITPPCSYTSCEEVPVALVIKNMEVFRSEGFKAPPATYGCVEIYGATEYGMHSDEFTIEFRARYGTFASPIAGGKYEPAHYCSKYEEPSCPENMPADGYDMAWVVVYNRTKHTYVESEQVVFNIEEPEEVHHPVG